MSWLSKIPRKKNNLAWRTIDNEAILIPLENQPKDGEEVYILNESAAAIWELIDGKSCIADLIKKVNSKFAIGHKEIESELKRFFDKLSRKEWIEL